MTNISTEEIAELARKFNEEGIRYTIVGGVAIILWGVSKPTFDVDFSILPDDAKKAINLLFSEGYRPTEPFDEVDRIFQNIDKIRHVIFVNTLVIDLVLKMEGVDVFKVWKHRHPYNLHGVSINVISFEDLYKNKDFLARRYGGIKDTFDLQQMKVIMENMGKKKPIPSRCVYRHRKINDKIHLVKIRKIGKEVETKIVL